MKLMYPEQKASLAAILKAHGIAADLDKDLVEYMALWDIQDVTNVRTTEVKVFDTATSSEKLHALLEWGCNLPVPGQLNDNESFVCKRLECELLEGTVATKVTDAIRWAAYGRLKQFLVGGQIKVANRPIGPILKGRTVRPNTPGEGAGAAAFFGVIPSDDGMELGVVDQIVIPKGNKFGLRVDHNGPTADWTAAIKMKFVLWGWRITHGS